MDPTKGASLETVLILSSLGHDTRRKMAFFIESEYKAKFSEIRDHLELSDNNARFHLRCLMKAGLVEQIRARGNYKITKTGSLALELIRTLEIMWKSVEALKT